MQTFSFGDTPEMADKLLTLVIEEKKRATSWAATHGTNGSKIGEQEIITDSSGRPRALIGITELTCKPFTEVDEQFARDEGEGDLSLTYWRTEHERFFKKEGTFSNDMKVYCERFKLIKVLD